MKRPDLTGGVIAGGIITVEVEVFASEGVVSGVKPSKSSDFWLPVLEREVVNGFRVIHWMLYNAMPAMVRGVLVLFQQKLVVAALHRVRSTCVGKTHRTVPKRQT